MQNVQALHLAGLSGPDVIPSRLFDTAPPAPPPARFGATALKAGVLSASTAMLMPVLRRIAGDRVGGETLDDAWRVVRRLQAGGLGYSLGFWDAPGDTPKGVLDVYLAAIERVGAAGADGYLSIKPPALHFDAGTARRLARAARAANVRLHCDSHGIEVADLTLSFAEALLQELPAGLVSVTTPGRWARSPDDAARVMDQGIGVRIVKGQWPDPADPARDMEAGFLAVVDRAAGRKARVSVATHRVVLAAEAMRRLKAAGGAFDLELIFGLQTDPLLGLARAADAPASLYVPFGRGFAPNALGILRRNPSLALDVLRSMARSSAGRLAPMARRRERMTVAAPARPMA